MKNVPALAAGARCCGSKRHFFRNLFSPAARAAKNSGFSH
jgi:hypothetical protein